ncbi:MAG: hypothetical protein J7623_19745 [Chitinophaga sp.]|uniref:hypothetical protein n=1 Tax=Chitinophaga sp. TaxID=1869181 RepID=UPI001B180768|nr:hypothetical protein [Chitinophaga sp.]MBO9730883.1 hypothetical protein [Chitinophaga sp.]
MRCLLILLLFPAALFAQKKQALKPVHAGDNPKPVIERAPAGNGQNEEVQPVYSADYQQLIAMDTSVMRSPSPLHKVLQLKKMFSADTRLRKISIRNNELRLYPDYKTTLVISGSYSATVTLKTVSRQPALQSEYVQGRSLQGNLAWQGPETNELFSYGPSRQTLEYDGQPYAYDYHGKLVPAGSGNGHNPIAYMNNIFRTGTAFSQLFNLKAALRENQVNVLEFGMNLGNTSEQTVIRENNNYEKNMDASLGARIKWLHLLAKYSYNQNQFSNSNRNGFLNQTWQQALLTPNSFDNGQGYTLGNRQRSYSQMADNPDFLLNDNNHGYRFTRQQASLLMERNSYRRVKYVITQSYDDKQEDSREGYKPGSANFPDGQPLNRYKTDQFYQLQLEASANLPYHNHRWNGGFLAQYIFTDAHTAVHYQPLATNYQYQRSTQEVMATYRQTYSWERWNMNLVLGNKAYASNTAAVMDYFQPSADLSVTYNFSYTPWTLGFKSSFGEYNRELPISQSLAYLNLLQYNAASASRYFPVQEVGSFDHLKPIRNRSWSNSITISKSLVDLTAAVFIKKVTDDLFPVYDQGAWVLKNRGDYQTEGIDLQLRLLELERANAKIKTTQVLGFYAYRTKVTAVREGANYTPLAGFSDVHTTLVEGAPLGVITGSTWQKDGNGNRVIGPDGFPLVASAPAIIANPTPDFVMKWNSTVQWKKWKLLTVMEWKKGGERWNGTQAVLDYFGRSQSSAEGRKIKNYVFPGVQGNDKPNTTPVDFYNPALPVEQNRWVRYGHTGVAADYVERADWLRLKTLKLSHELLINRLRKRLILSAYVNNIMLWTPYSGTDPEQLLFDQTNSTGLDFFNLPATKTYGFNVTLQF